MKFFIDSKYIEEGLISEKEHPSEPYLIYNYTQKCQFAKAWDETTKQCRGLIVHKETREIIARPFSKFFNYEEHVMEGSTLPKIPEGEIPEVYDKRDGSIGILYFGTDGMPWIATRGSFTSDQAIWATNYFREHHAGHWFNTKFTFLFEIIFPENRIVVNYGGREGLDLLAIIDTETGEEMAFNPAEEGFKKLGIPAEQYSFSSVEELKAKNTQNIEGFVLFFRENKMRVKIKFEEYVKLHKVMTGLSEIGIWEMLRDGKDIIAIMEDVPDEMHQWLVDVSLKILNAYQEIENNAMLWEAEAKKKETRKEQAEIVTKAPYPGIVFSMLDGKDYQKALWRMVRPHGQKTFKVDIDS